MDFTIKYPIAGFEYINTMQLTQVDDFFYQLKSNDDDTISFTLIDPFKIREYEFELPTHCRLLLNIKDKTDILVLNIMITTQPIENSTINFAAPLVFNRTNNTMMQTLLNDNECDKYGFAENISKFLNK